MGEAKKLHSHKKAYAGVRMYPAYEEHVGNYWRKPEADGDVDDGTGDAEIIE